MQRRGEMFLDVCKILSLLKVKYRCKSIESKAEKQLLCWH